MALHDETLTEERRRLSETFGGRSTLFRRHQAADPRFGNITPIARSALQSRFAPQSSQFALGLAQDPEGFRGNFTDFLGNIHGQNNSVFGRSDFNSAFSNLGSLFGGDELTADQQTSRAFLTDNEPQAQNIISQAFTSGLNPILRGFGGNVIQNAVDRFRDSDASTGLFEQFLKNGFAGFGGGFVQ